jgi:hypothetical protein
LQNFLKLRFYLLNLKTAVGGEVLREDVVADALGGVVKAHLLVRRTKPTSADAITDSARRHDSTAVFRFNLIVPEGEQINVACRAWHFALPNQKEHRTFEKKTLSVGANVKGDKEGVQFQNELTRG